MNAGGVQPKVERLILLPHAIDGVDRVGMIADPDLGELQPDRDGALRAGIADEGIYHA
jgi:hypothetical protein